MKEVRGLGLTVWISSSFFSFLEIVEMADSFLSSNMRVPEASSIMARISGGFMFRTLVILPCMMRKCGLLTLS